MRSYIEMADKLFQFEESSVILRAALIGWSGSTSGAPQGNMLCGKLVFVGVFNLKDICNCYQQFCFSCLTARGTISIDV